MQRKAWLKARRLHCKYCGVYVQYSGDNHQFCSFSCRNSHRAERVKAWRDAVHFMFILDKERTGCKDCGYHQYGGALDYHHINSTTKEGRIDALGWYAQSQRYKQEIEKCILLCKNCHYERHSKM